MEALLQDLSYGVRKLLKRPGFTFIAVLTLALGIGACTAIFSVVDAVLLRSLPYPDSHRVVELRELNQRGTQVNLAEPNFDDLRALNRDLDSLALYEGEPTTVTGGSEAVRADAYAVSKDFFKVLGVQPITGRTCAAEKGKEDAGAEVVVSYGFWQRLLGGRPDLANAHLKLANQSFSVVGVMPPGFKFPEGAEIWLPKEIFPPNTSRTAHNWRAVARLRAGVTLEQARADLGAIGRQLKQQYGKDTDAVSFALTPIQEFQAKNVRLGLLILLGAVGFLLLIACANVINLLLAEATSRQKELAVRAALGATSFRLARQFITESLALALIAGALGALFSSWGVNILVALNHHLPRADEITVNARVLLFTLALSLLIAVVLGLVPALRNSENDLESSLRESGRGQSTNAFTRRLCGLLVVSQVALTVVLFTGAALLGKSFLQLLKIDPGFRPESAVAMDVSLPYPENDEQQQQLARFHQQLFEHVSQLPGVTAVGGINALPMTAKGSNGTFLIDDDKSKPGDAEYRVASGGYFSAMGIPLLRGRLFDQSDTPNSPHAAVISQSLARKYFANEDPIGRHIQFGNMDGYKQLLEIVGVVGDVREDGLDHGVAPTIYVNYYQRPKRAADFSVVARANIDPPSLITAMRRELQKLNPDVPTNFRTIEQIFSSSLDYRRFSLVLFGFFAAAGLLLAVTGIYGVMAYSVAERTREIGIRMALGARATDVLRLVLSNGMTLALIGVAIGLAGALALTRLLTSLLFGVTPTDSSTFAIVPLCLITVALFACYIPARRATKVDPLVALRYE